MTEMPFLNFKFSGEKTTTTLNGPASAETGVYLDGGRLGDDTNYVTRARTRGSDFQPDKTSVVNATSSTWPLCCFGRWARCGCTRPVMIAGAFCYRITFTRAQWVWLMNFVCFLVHATMTYLCFTSCNATRFGTVINSNCTAEAMSVTIYRVEQHWNSTGANGIDLMLTPNNMPVRFDYLVGWFFLLSALFHFFALLIGPFDHWAGFYWLCIDNALCYWRWVEYSLSASVMIIALYILIGVREQNILAAAFFLMFSVNMFGLVTEMVSRPAERRIDGSRGWVGDPEETEEILMLRAKKLRFDGRDSTQHRLIDPYARKLEECDDPRERREYERMLALQRDHQTAQPLTYMEDFTYRRYLRAYRMNYVRRMIPHVIGIFPYVTTWIIFVNYFFTALDDLKVQDEGLFDRVPGWVPIAIGGTVLIFTSFTFPQIFWQYQTPDDYWKTEIVYCILSLTSKLFLGLLLYSNVLLFASFEGAMSDTPASRRAASS